MKRKIIGTITALVVSTAVMVIMALLLVTAGLIPGAGNQGHRGSDSLEYATASPKTESEFITEYGAIDDGSMSYAIIQTDGEMVFTRSMNEYSNGTDGTLVDRKGNSYSGLIYHTPNTASMHIPAWSKKVANVTEVSFVDWIQPQFNTYYLFGGMKNLTTLNLDGLDTSRVTVMNSMFSECSSLENVDLSMLDVSNVDSFSNMFYKCPALKSVNVSGWDTSKATRMERMFEECTSLKTPDLSSFDMANVEYIGRMFYNCNSLENVNTDGWDTSKVKDMSYMFYNCSSLSSLDLSRWDTSSVVNMSYMFQRCSTLSSLTLDGLFSTDSLQNASYMFYDCRALTSLDLSGWDTPNITNITFMFDGCQNLASIKGTGSWDTSKITSMNHVFYGCQALKSLDLSGWDTAKVSNADGAFCNCFALEELIFGDKWSVENLVTANCMFSGCKVLPAPDVSGWNVSKLQNARDMFRTCYAFTSLDVGNWDTSSLTDMSGMFYMDSALEELDVSKWKTDKVVDMSSAFRECSSLTTLDVSQWNTGSVKNFNGTFYMCSSISELDVSQWDTGNTTRMGSIFQGCSSLTNLDVGNWETGNVTEMSSAFADCTKLETVNPGNWNVENATNLSGMFSNCPNLLELDLGGWNTENAKNIAFMFRGCSSLKVLDLSNFDTRNVPNSPSGGGTMSELFKDDTSLKKLIVGPNWSNPTSINYYQSIFPTTLARVDDKSYDIYAAGSVVPTYMDSPAGVNIYAYVEFFDLEAQVVWDDEDDNDGIRPDTIDAVLYADGTEMDDKGRVIGEDELSWDGLVKVDENGHEIAYTLDCPTAGDMGYTTTPADKDNIYTLTLKHEPITRTIAGAVQWIDDDNAYSTRPSTLDITLYDGDEVETFSSASDDWEYAFQPVRVYRDGQVISYSIEAEAIPGYKSTISEDLTLITETYDPEPAVVDTLEAGAARVETGDGGNPATLSFTVEPDEEGVSPVAVPVEANGSYVIDMGTFTFEKPGTYTATVSQAAENLNGWVADEWVKTIEFTVADTDVDGKLDCSFTPVVFRETYTPEAALLSDVLGTLEVSGEEIPARDFVFDIEAADGTPSFPGSSTLTLKVDKTGSYEMSVSGVPFEEAGVFEYKFSFQPGEAEKGWTVETEQDTFQVTVADDGTGKLVATVDALAAFKANYLKPTHSIVYEAGDGTLDDGNKTRTDTVDDGTKVVLADLEVFTAPDKCYVESILVKPAEDGTVVYVDEAGKQVDKADATAMLVYGDVLVSAEYAPYKYLVLHDGLLGTDKTLELKAGERGKLPMLECDGYEFKGWKTDVDASLAIEGAVEGELSFAGYFDNQLLIGGDAGSSDAVRIVLTGDEEYKSLSVTEANASSIVVPGGWAAYMNDSSEHVNGYYMKAVWAKKVVSIGEAESVVSTPKVIVQMGGAADVLIAGILVLAVGALIIASVRRRARR